MQRTVFFNSREYRYSQARQAPRLQTEFCVEVLDGRPCRERAIDLSAAGLGIRTTQPRPLPLMSLVTLRLHLPDGLAPLEILGRVMWWTRQGLGFRFEKVDPRITALVNRA